MSWSCPQNSSRVISTYFHLFVSQGDKTWCKILILDSSSVVFLLSFSLSLSLSLSPSLSCLSILFFFILFLTCSVCLLLAFSLDDFFIQLNLASMSQCLHSIHCFTLEQISPLWCILLQLHFPQTFLLQWFLLNTSITSLIKWRDLHLALFHLHPHLWFV